MCRVRVGESDWEGGCPRRQLQVTTSQQGFEGWEGVRSYLKDEEGGEGCSGRWEQPGRNYQTACGFASAGPLGWLSHGVGERAM